MEFTCEKKDLQRGVSAVEKIVTTRSTLPIAGYVLFQADKNGLRFSANNLDLGVDLGIAAKIIKEGSVLIPAKTLSGIVSRLPETKIAFKLTEKGTMMISFGQSNFNVNTLPADEFPSLSQVKDGKKLTLATAVLASMIKQTIFSVATSEEKHILTGVLLDLGKGIIGDESNIRLVSTDGFRLARRGEKTRIKEEVKGKVIIPAKALQELFRLIELESDAGELTINFSAEQIAFQFNDVNLVSRIIQGQFPDFRQVMPKKSSCRLIINRKSFLEAADRAGVIAAGSANIVRFEIKNDKLHLFASTPDVGTVDEVVEVRVKGEAKNQIAFNIRLIVDALKIIETDDVVLELSENLGPGVIKEGIGDNYIYIVMPIKTQEGG
ncbi:DNA polymerase III subunit beta [Candidatus Saganbacteria bacterium]|nr:DNA polymerase III subunit beta [Candidatus Saganbacteria bacterium]